tara:strand:+ start:2705 stop:3748 length:1044 start_codon:yes stop_codon:yes gene_type:complete
MGRDDNHALLQMFFAAHLSQAVGHIAEIGVADLVGEDGTRRVSDLALETGCHERTLYRVMRYLASHGIFVEQDDRAFGHTSLSKALRSEAENSFRPVARMLQMVSRGLAGFDHTLKTEGSALAHVFGEPIFDYLSTHPDEAAIFDAAMPAFHVGEIDAMLDAYDFSEIGTVADIGGGGGAVITGVLQNHPGMRGVLFDLGHVIGRAQENLERDGVADRCRTVEGSFFDTVPDGADAYLMRHIIHDWSDADSVRILENCRKAVPAGGRLLIVETIVPEGNDPSPAKEMDVMMLLYPGGMERTETEYRELFAAAGFEKAGQSSEPLRVRPHSARSASIGSSRAARRTGR